MVIVALQFIVKPPVTKIINGPPDAVNVPPPLTGIPTPPVEEPPISVPEKIINVEWNAQPKKVDPNVIFANLNHDTSLSSPVPFPGGTIGGIYSNFVFWEKGVARGQVFNGYKVYAMTYDEGGMATSREMSYIIISSEGGYAETDSDFDSGTWLSTYLTKVDAKFVFNVEEPPKELMLRNGRMIVRSDVGGIAPDPRCTRAGCSGRKETTSTKDGWLVYSASSTDEVYDVLLDLNGCLAIFGEDGIGYGYVSLIPSKREDLVGTPAEGGADAVLANEISWSNLITNPNGFYLPYQRGGCGVRPCAEIVDDSELRGAVIVGGKTKNGDDIYVAKDPANFKRVKEVYESWIGYDFLTQEKPTFEDFLKNHPVPVFFWRDALGRWVQYYIMDVQPQAECGKPVIYLYPEKVTNVSVRLPSFINVTESEPTYPASGWNVTANPDGQLVMRDGARFGSLYWEGTGVGYKAPKDGFILKDGEVDSRLAEILKKYGLNQTESREFREFWVPKMTGAPYYRVSFLTSAWSKAAPLYVSPAPATSIRIFMDWQKLKAPISIPEPKIETPVRRGFTLVEWGGLLMK